MIKLDDNLLTELGLQSLPAEDKKALLRHIYETLEMRVGTTLARQMTDAQLDEFESFINNNDEAGALRWLETNFPNYKDVVAQEFEVLKAEVRQSAPQIMASAGGAAAMPQQQMAPEMQQPQMTAPQPDYQQQYQQPYQQPMPQQQPYAQPYEVQQQPYSNTAPAQPMAQPMPAASVQQQPIQADYQQQYQPQQPAVSQTPQPMQQFDPMAQAPQQPYANAAPQYPQPVTPSPYQQPAQQAQPQQPQPPIDQNQFGQVA